MRSKSTLSTLFVLVLSTCVHMPAGAGVLSSRHVRRALEAETPRTKVPVLDGKQLQHEVTVTATVPTLGERGLESDELWDSRFALPGTDTGFIYAVAVHGEEIVIGGQFNTVGRTEAHNVARWTGTRWESLGQGTDNGVNGPVYAVGIVGGAVFVGGQFTQAGGVLTNNVAKFTAGGWSDLRAGVTAGFVGGGARVTAISTVGYDVFVGGIFSEAGGIAVGNIAQWNETEETWRGLGLGISSRNPDDVPFVRAIAATEQCVFVGGKFDQAGGEATRNIAAWNRVQSRWSMLGSGANNWVTALAATSDGVVAGGSFKKIGGKKAKFIARWNGRTWRRLGRGLEGSINGIAPAVNGIAIVGTRFYVAGGIAKAGSAVVSGVAVWDGQDWASVGDGLLGVLPDGNVVSRGAAAIGASEDAIAVVGDFTHVGALPAFGVAEYDLLAQSWNSVTEQGQYLGAKSGPIASDSMRVFTCQGNVYQVGDQFRRGLLKLDEASWASDGPGSDELIRGAVYATAVSGNDVYVGGFLGGVGDIVTRNIVKWDGTRWSALGSGVGGGANSQVTSIVVDGSDVYVAGIFTDADGVSVNNIAKWDGERWSALGSGSDNGVAGEGAIVEALAVRNGDVFVGGRFEIAGGIPARNIARWNDDGWSPLSEAGSNGVDGTVFALSESSSGLWVGGDFAFAASHAARALALWDGATWSSVPQPLTYTEETTPTVFAIAVEGTTVYVGGLFLHAGDLSTSYIAQWDGERWESLGSGVNAFVDTIIIAVDGVYCSGGFSVAGGKPSVGVAKWMK